MTLALVTGATGLLGGQVVKELLAADYRVRAFVRLSSDTRPLAALPVEIVRGEAENMDDLRRAVEGAAWVFHAAGYLNAGSPFGSDENDPCYRAINVEFTDRLLAASLEAEVQRFVFASSNSVYALDAPAPVSEDAPLRPLGDYGRSKVAAEDRVRSYQRRGLATTIVRPCVIYGEGDRHFTPVALRLARLPLLPLIGGGGQRFDLVHVSDAADLMLIAARAEAAIGRTYNAGPHAPTSLRELVEAYRELAGRGPRIVSISPAAMRRAAPLSRLFLRLLVPGAEAMLTPTGLELMTRDIGLDTGRAKEELGFEARVGLREGLRRTLKGTEYATRNT